MILKTEWSFSRSRGIFRCGFFCWIGTKVGRCLLWVSTHRPSISMNGAGSKSVLNPFTCILCGSSGNIYVGYGVWKHIYSTRGIMWFLNLRDMIILSWDIGEKSDFENVVRGDPFDFLGQKFFFRILVLEWVNRWRWWRISSFYEVWAVLGAVWACFRAIFRHTFHEFLVGWGNILYMGIKL